MAHRRAASGSASCPHAHSQPRHDEFLGHTRCQDLSKCDHGPTHPRPCRVNTEDQRAEGTRTNPHRESYSTQPLRRAGCLAVNTPVAEGVQSRISPSRAFQTSLPVTASTALSACQARCNRSGRCNRKRPRFTPLQHATPSEEAEACGENVHSTRRTELHQVQRIETVRPLGPKMIHCPSSVGDCALSGRITRSAHPLSSSSS